MTGFLKRIIEDRAGAIAKRAIGLGLGAVFAAIGLGFLTNAAWVKLALELSAVDASLIIGGLYVFAALISATAVRKRKATPPPPPVQRSGVDANELLAVFLTAAQTGRSMRR